MRRINLRVRQFCVPGVVLLSSVKEGVCSVGVLSLV